MTLIRLLGTTLCLSLAVATGTVGNWEIASFFASLPVAYWIIHAALHAKRRKQEADRAKKQMIEDEYQRIRKEREARREADHLQTPSQAQQAYNQQVLAAQQRHHMRAMAAQQAQMQAAQNQRFGYGFSDPRAALAQQQPDNSFMNAMMANVITDALMSGTGVARTRQDDTGSVVVEHVPVREVYRSADPEPERSSSSSSSDTSSDSFSSSDTGSDSF